MPAGMGIGNGNLKLFGALARSQTAPSGCGFEWPRLPHVALATAYTLHRYAGKPPEIPQQRAGGAARRSARARAPSPQNPLLLEHHLQPTSSQPALRTGLVASAWVHADSWGGLNLQYKNAQVI